jgi:exosortase
MHGASSSHRAAGWVIPILAIAAVYVGLFVLVPYNSGYGNVRVSSLSIAYSFWTGYEDFLHGMFVPFISAIVVWLKREALRQVPVHGSWWGLPLLVVAFGTYWIGYLIDHHYVGWVSAQILVAAIIVWYLGWAMMRALLFPWAFLIFTWPFLFLDNYIAFPLRLLMTDLAYHMLNFVGLACVRSGSRVQSAPDHLLGIEPGALFAVDIADPCSGIRSLFALMMIGALYAHFTMPKTWQKVLLFLSSVPLAIAGNFVRILMLTFGTLVLGPQIAIGKINDPSLYHTLSGFVVFIVALVGMIGFGSLITTDPRELWKLVLSLPARFKPPQPAVAGPKRPSDFDTTPDIY